MRAIRVAPHPPSSNVDDDDDDGDDDEDGDDDDDEDGEDYGDDQHSPGLIPSVPPKLSATIQGYFPL